MEILRHENGKELLNDMPHVRSSLNEWLFVDIRLIDKNFVIANMANSIQPLFKDKEGKIYICNDHEILVLLRWGKTWAISEITESVERRLLEGSCMVRVHECTLEGLAKLERLITHKKAAAPSMADTRATRRENVILLADDDMFIRILVKNAIASQATVREVEDGNEIIGAYKRYAPDILFLDIHMPNREGTDVMNDILPLDPEAYIVMLSADGSRENIETSMQNGARDFLTKPFTKDKLLEFVKKCPTIG